MKLVVTYEGKQHELGQPTLKDFVLLERHFKVSAAAIGDEPRMEYMVFLAWSALKRNKVEVPDTYTDAFLDGLDAIDNEDDEDDEVDPDADPTGAAKAQP